MAEEDKTADLKKEESGTQETVDSPDKSDRDMYVYWGKITMQGYDLISKEFEKKRDERKKGGEEQKNKICLALVTSGGDPHAAYKIARYMRHHYKEIEILVPYACKSAGTLLCIGADKLIICDSGELGPLDVQLKKTDEIRLISGLSIHKAMEDLEQRMTKVFMNNFRAIFMQEISSDIQIIADVSQKIAKSFVDPIVRQIDPITLGDHQRQIEVAYQYGLRLSAMTNSLKNAPEDVLRMLVSGYPDHSFVIDREEAKKYLFSNVCAPCDSDEENKNNEIKDFYTHIRKKNHALIEGRIWHTSPPSVVEYSTLNESRKETQDNE